MKICVLVNGEKSGIFARRIEYFRRYAISFKNSFICYRENKYKFLSVFAFAYRLILIRPELVYVEAVAFSACMAALFLKPFLKFKYIISTGDDYKNIITRLYGNFRGALAGVLERATYRCADLIITLAYFHKDYLLSKGYENVICIEHGIDTEKFKPFPVPELRQKLGLENNLVIGLVGTIVIIDRNFYTYGWEIIETINILKESAVKGLIIGNGNGLNYLIGKAKSYGILDKIVFTGKVEHNRVPFYINCMDICISTQSNDIVGKVRTPINTKVSEYLPCGKFIISTDIGYTKDVIEKVGVALPYNGVKDDSYPARVAGAVKTILQNRTVLEKGRNGIDIARERLDFKKLAEKLDKAIKELMHG